MLCRDPASPLALDGDYLRCPVWCCENPLCRTRLVVGNEPAGLAALRSKTGADVRYENLIVDARDAELTDSTRVRAAFDAIYCCSPGLKSLAQSLAALGLNADDVSLVRRLADWVLNVAPRGPLPMTPSEAVALAARVHKASGGK